MNKMTKNLLATTAIFALMAPAGFADNHTLSTDTNANIEVEASTKDGVKVGGEVKNETQVNSSTNKADGEANPGAQMSANALLATNFLNKQVFVESEGEFEVAGDVNDVVMDKDGNAEWIIVGVGGFLGIGEKEVALSATDIHWEERDGERIIVTHMATADLEASPTFNRAQLEADAEYSPDRLSWTEEGRKWIEEAQKNAQATFDEMTSEGEAKMEDGQDMAVEGQDMGAEGELNADGTAQMNTDADWNWEADDMEIVANAELSSEQLIGTRVYGPGLEDVGEISDVLLTQDGQVTAYIVDVGGFLGLGEKPVA